jgi:hypothetical protein
LSLARFTSKIWKASLNIVWEKQKELKMKHLFFLSLILILSSCGGTSNLESAEESGEEVSQETEEGNVRSEWVNLATDTEDIWPGQVRKANSQPQS